MTNKEAIKYIGITEDMLKEALEKQVAKKPVAHYEINDIWYSCPSCNSFVYEPYCTKCGQKLDWSEIWQK